MSDYSEKLKDPRWQKRRLEIFTRDKWTCRGCESTTKTLHVHHKRYEWGKSPWEYQDEDLITLCEGCHDLEGDLSKADYYAEIAQASGMLNIKLWLFTNAISYLQLTKPEVLEEVRELIFTNTFGSDKIDFNKFIANPLTYKKTSSNG